MNGIDKETYIGIVKFTLESMVDLAKSDKNYNLTADTIHIMRQLLNLKCKLARMNF